MSDIVENLKNIKDKLRAGVCGQREIWEQQLEEAIAAHADLSRRLAEAGREIERLRAGLERVMIGGNHLATWRGDRWPDYNLDGLTREQQCENALRILGATRDYDMWVCWSTLMQVRDALTAPAEARTHPRPDQRRDRGR